MLITFSECIIEILKTLVNKSYLGLENDLSENMINNLVDCYLPLYASTHICTSPHLNIPISSKCFVSAFLPKYHIYCTGYSL